MSKSVLEKAEEHIVDPMHKVSRATTAVAEAIEDGIHAVKRVGKTSSDVAEEMIDDAKERVKRHPMGTIVAAFVVGFAFGGFIDALIRRK
ncbi:MAG TPA: hypothetical protein VF840_07470 [Terriglobales bacterium]